MIWTIIMVHKRPIIIFNRLSGAFRSTWFRTVWAIQYGSTKDLPVIRTRNCIKFINENISNRITHQVSFIPFILPCSSSGQIEFLEETELTVVECDFVD